MIAAVETSLTPDMLDKEVVISEWSAPEISAKEKTSEGTLHLSTYLSFPFTMSPAKTPLAGSLSFEISVLPSYCSDGLLSVVTSQP